MYIQIRPAQTEFMACFQSLKLFRDKINDLTVCRWKKKGMQFLTIEEQRVTKVTSRVEYKHHVWIIFSILSTSQHFQAIIAR